jgi:hypothetical protein
MYNIVLLSVLLFLDFILTNMTVGSSTMPLHWHDVIKKNLWTCTLLTEVSSSMARRKVTCSDSGGRATETEAD